jgi:choline monooxygenase
MPARLYVDRDVFHAERDAVFSRAWLLAGSSRSTPRPGDQVAVDLGHWRVLLVRGDDGILRAFHNVCRHRAGALLWDGESCHARSIRCRYHGWRYELSGRLQQATGFGEELDRDAWGLFPLPCAEWRGLAFVHPGPDPEPLERQLAAFATAAGSLDWSGCEPIGVASHPIACNWKVYVENYLEGYHVPYLHLGLARDVDLDTYEVRPADRCAIHVARPAGDGAVNDGFWAWLWPNAALNVYRHGTCIERIVPAGPDRTELHYTYVAAPTASAAEREAMLDMSGTLTVEDARICEVVHRNLAGGQYVSGRLSPRHETGVAAFQETVLAALNFAP